MKKNAELLAVLVTVMVGVFVLPVCAAEPTAAERVVVLKAHIAESQAVLRQYEWLETTIVSIDKMEKSCTQQRVFYDVDGIIRADPMVRKPDPQNKNSGLCDHHAVPKKFEMTRYMQDAVHLVHQYIPLNPNGLQSVADDGTLSFTIIDPATRGRLTIKNFLVRGDSVNLDLDLTNNQPLSLNINSYLDSEQDPLTLAVTMGSLYGSATFAREAVLESKQKKLKIIVKNSEYRKIAP
jgi:hypothetical protein